MDHVQTALRVLDDGGSDEEWAVVGRVLRPYLEDDPAARAAARRWALDRLQGAFDPGPALATPEGSVA